MMPLNGAATTVAAVLPTAPVALIAIAPIVSS
jgi:hypothetical protein